MKKNLLLLLIFINIADVYSQQRQQRQRQPQQQQRRSGQRPANNRRAVPKKPVVRAQVAKRPPSPQPFVLLASNFGTWEAYLSSPEEGRIKYNSVYYNTKTRKFFYSQMDEVSNIQYTFIPSQNAEIIADPSIQETTLLYVGNLKPNQRILVNTNRNKFYMKTLVPIPDDTYLDNGDNVYTNDLPVFPFLNTLYEVQYTNENRQLFNRILSDSGRLRLLGTPPLDMKTIPSFILDPATARRLQQQKQRQQRQQQQRQQRQQQNLQRLRR